MNSIFFFWLSLAFTSFFMALEVPLCVGVISRMEDSRDNLAAFGVVAAIALLIQAPVLRLSSLALICIKDEFSYVKIRRFSFVFSFLISCVFLIIAIDPVFKLIVVPLLGVESSISELVQRGLIMWSPFPLLVGARRFFQGVLLLAHLPKKIANATFIRLVLIFLSLTLLYMYSDFNGVEVGVLSIGAGMFGEMLASYLFSKRHRPSIIENDQKAHSGLSYVTVLNTYLPLSISSSIAMLGAPISSFLIARGKFPMESLALIPVIFGLMNPFTWTAFAIQDTTHALLTRDPNSYEKVKQFTYVLGACLSAVLFFIVVSPLAVFYFKTISSLSQELYQLVKTPSLIIPLIPFTMALRNFYRGEIISKGKGKNLLISEGLEVATVTIIFILLNLIFDSPALTIAMWALWTGALSNLVYLVRKRKV